MFRAPLCSSSGESIVLMWHLLYVTLCRLTVTCAGLDGTAVSSKPAHVTVTYIEWHIPNFTLIQLILLVMSTEVLETCRELEWIYTKKALCVKLVICKNYAYLLISLPYLISSMYGHRLFLKIILIFISISGQPMWDLWWTKWHCDRFSLEYLGFTLSVSFPQSSIVNFI